MKYKVSLQITTILEKVVDAKDEDEAGELAIEAYEAGEVLDVVYETTNYPIEVEEVK